MQISTDVDDQNMKQIKKLLKQLGNKGPDVLRMAINDTARKARAGIPKNVSKIYTIKQKDFKQFETVQFATKARLTAKINIKSQVLTVYKYFQSKPNVPGIGGKGARIKVMKNSSFSEVGTPKLFVATMRSGHTGVFQRRPGKKRGEHKEIREMLGPSAPNMVYNRINGVYDEEYQRELNDYLMQRIHHQIERLTSQQ